MCKGAVWGNGALFSLHTTLCKTYINNACEGTAVNTVQDR